VTGNKLQWFSQRSRMIIDAAEEVAHHWHYDQVDSEHLLFALSRSPEFYPMFYERIGLNTSILHKRIIGDRHFDAVTPVSSISLSNDFKQIIRLAIDEMRKHTHSFVHPEHILMAMSRLPKCNAVRIINEQNVGLSELQHQAARLFDERETFFDGDVLTETPIKMGDKYYDGQPIHILIQNSVTLVPVV
jgi:ATP-dependent Clp protease ATP-binding subunit ClpC